MRSRGSTDGKERDRRSFLLFSMVTLLLFVPERGAAYDPIRIPSTPIRRTTIEGNRALDDNQVRGMMERTRGSWFRPGRYRSKWLDKDLQDVVRHYGTLGYLDARIAEKAVTWTGDRRAVDIRVVIDEGIETVLDTILFDGLPPLSRDELTRRLLLKEGKPYNRELVNLDRIRVYGYLAEKGYAGAEVDTDERIDGKSATITFEVRAGPRMKIGPIRVAGTKETKERFVARELTFHEGDWFNRQKLFESRDRVYRTGLYYNVAMQREPTVDGNVVPLRIDVRERKVRWFEFGGGFGTEDLFRFSVDWSNKNWMRTGRRIGAEAVYSDLLADRPYEQRYELFLIEPWMFRTRTVGLWKISHARQNIENFVIEGEEDEADQVVERYRLIQTATSFSLSREISEIFKWWLTYSVEWAKAREPSEPIEVELLRPDITRSLGFTLERDARDHLLDPSRGTRIHTNLEFAGNFLGGDAEFLKWVAGGSAYQNLGGRFVLAERLKVGGLRPIAGDDAVPDHKLFRIGGSNTVRGYREESIGPAKNLLLASAEIRFPLFWRFGGVLFVDGGNTWERIDQITASGFQFRKDPEETNRNDFRYGVGAGIRLFTPVGPLRIDYARKTKRLLDDTGEPESESVIHFNIGQAF